VCLAWLHAVGRAGVGALPWCLRTGCSQTRSQSVPAPVAPRAVLHHNTPLPPPEQGAPQNRSCSTPPHQGRSLPKPVPLPARPSPSPSASGKDKERTFSKVYLMTFKHHYFHAGLQVIPSDKPSVSPDFGRTLLILQLSLTLPIPTRPLPNNSSSPRFKINLYISDTKIVLLEK